MKKFMSILMLVLLTITLSACGNKKPGYQAYESLTFSQEQNAKLATQYLIMGRDIKAGKVSITCNEATGKDGAEDGVCKFYAVTPETFVENGSANVVGNDGNLHFQNQLSAYSLSSDIEKTLRDINNELYMISIKQDETFQINQVIDGKTIFVIQPSSQNEKINYTVSSDGSGKTDGKWIYENNAESNSYTQVEDGTIELYPARALVGKDNKPGKVKFTCQESDSDSCYIGLLVTSDAGTARTYHMGENLAVGDSIEFDLNVVVGDQICNYQPNSTGIPTNSLKKQTILIETVEEE